MSNAISKAHKLNKLEKNKWIFYDKLAYKFQNSNKIREQRLDKYPKETMKELRKWSNNRNLLTNKKH